MPDALTSPAPSAVTAHPCLVRRTRCHRVSLLVLATALGLSVPAPALARDQAQAQAQAAVTVPQPCDDATVAAAIYTIQGRGTRSPLAGCRVITSGVVTQLTNNGFFMQDPAGDGDPLTSDGIFVFSGRTRHPAVAVGNRVELQAAVVEFAVGTGADAIAHPVTELTSVNAVTLTGSGHAVVPTLVRMPAAVSGDLERHEGMLVTLAGPLTVSQNAFLGRYGQLTLAVGGRLETPTNRFRPGSPHAVALADANARRRIVLDDGSSLQHPVPTPYLLGDDLPRAGATVGDITGVIDYGLTTASRSGPAGYKIHPTVVPVFGPGNARAAAPEPSGGRVRVAGFNVLNYFTSFTNGGGTRDGCMLGGNRHRRHCRGADNAQEFARQQAKIVAAMVAIDADVFGLMEIQNDGNVAVDDLAAALNAQVGAATYVSADLPADTGADAIRVAVIYKPARLRPLGAPASDGHSVNNRPPLAQTFTLPNGERFTVVVNHLKSKGRCPPSSDPRAAGNTDRGDGQGCWNLQRRQQTERLRAFVARRQAAVGSNHVLLIGDFNAYAQEDPIAELTDNGAVDQIERFERFGYSYVFDGAAGRLDHAFASPTLSARVVHAHLWHINADEAVVADYQTEFRAPESRCGSGGARLCPPDRYQPTPYRASDHDPVVVDLDLDRPGAVTASRERSVDRAGDEALIGRQDRRGRR